MQTVRWQTQQLHNKIMQDKRLNLSNNSAFNCRTVPLLCSYEMIFSLKSETCSSVTWSEWRGNSIGNSIELAFDSLTVEDIQPCCLPSFLVCAAGNSQEICSLPVLRAVAALWGSGRGLQCVSLHPWRTACSHSLKKKNLIIFVPLTS